ncbi:hypothetical protein P7C70_g6696, partial [Phenoliferia sp. Uapishka_3]
MALLFPTEQTPESVLSTIPSTASPADPFFIIFFASPDDTGRSWCGDCRAAEAPIANNISEQRSALVYAGGRSEWRDPSNAFRRAFGITRLPTIIKVTGAASSFSALQKSEMLVEGDVVDEEKLKKFVGV